MINWQNGTTPINETNMNKLVQEDMITDAYSSSSTYSVGDYCIYENTLYKCKTAITTAEAWNSAHWTAVTVTDEIKENAVAYSEILEILDIQEIPLTINENYVYSTDFDVYCYKVGKLVIIEFCEMAFTTSPETGETIISGVPTPISPTTFSLFGNNLAKGDTVRLHIRSNDINIHYKSPEHYANSANKQYSGVVIYKTNE